VVFIYLFQFFLLLVLYLKRIIVMRKCFKGDFTIKNDLKEMISQLLN